VSSSTNPLHQTSLFGSSQKRKIGAEVGEPSRSYGTQRHLQPASGSAARHDEPTSADACSNSFWIDLVHGILSSLTMHITGGREAATPISEGRRNRKFVCMVR